MTDDQIRRGILEAWERLGIFALVVHCGGDGLVVGCPVCGRVFR